MLLPSNPFSNVIPVKFRVPEPKRKKPVQDYLADYVAAMDLVKRLTVYHHSRGYKNVKVWLETDQFESGRKRYSIRSNIIFRTPLN